MARIKLFCVIVFSHWFPLALLQISHDESFRTPQDEFQTFNRSTKTTTLYDSITRMLAYKSFVKSRCYIENMEKGQQILKRIMDRPDKNLPKSLNIQQTELSKQQILDLAGRNITEFCRGFPTYLVQDFSKNSSESIDTELENNYIAARRKRSSRHYFVGRTGGQTQSQYLNFGNSNNSSGKAEAESFYGGSKAIVVANNGMGQAQSQSSPPLDCDECNGEGFVGPIGPPSGPFTSERRERPGSGPGITRHPGENTPDSYGPGERPGTFSPDGGRRPGSIVPGEGQRPRPYGPDEGGSTGTYRPGEDGWSGTNRPGEGGRPAPYGPDETGVPGVYRPGGGRPGAYLPGDRGQTGAYGTGEGGRPGTYTPTGGSRPGTYRPDGGGLPGTYGPGGDGGFGSHRPDEGGRPGTYAPGGRGRPGAYGPGGDDRLGTNGPGGEGRPGTYGPGGEGRPGTYGPGGQGRPGTYGPGGEGRPGSYRPDEGGRPGTYVPGEGGRPGSYGPDGGGRAGSYRPDEGRPGSYYGPDGGRPATYGPDGEDRPGTYRPGENRRPGTYGPDEGSRPGAYRPDERGRPGSHSPGEGRRPGGYGNGEGGQPDSYAPDGGGRPGFYHPGEGERPGAYRPSPGTYGPGEGKLPGSYSNGRPFRPGDYTQQTGGKGKFSGTFSGEYETYPPGDRRPDDDHRPRDGIPPRQSERPGYENQRPIIPGNYRPGQGERPGYDTGRPDSGAAKPGYYTPEDGGGYGRETGRPDYEPIRPDRYRPAAIGGPGYDTGSPSRPVYEIERPGYETKRPYRPDDYFPSGNKIPGYETERPYRPGSGGDSNYEKRRPNEGPISGGTGYGPGRQSIPEGPGSELGSKGRFSGRFSGEFETYQSGRRRPGNGFKPGSQTGRDTPSDYDTENSGTTERPWSSKRPDDYGSGQSDRSSTNGENGIGERRPNYETGRPDKFSNKGDEVQRLPNEYNTGKGGYGTDRPFRPGFDINGESEYQTHMPIKPGKYDSNNEGTAEGIGKPHIPDNYHSDEYEGPGEDGVGPDRSRRPGDYIDRERIPDDGRPTQSGRYDFENEVDRRKPEDHLRPNESLDRESSSDDSGSQVQTSVQQTNNETQAAASAQGKFQGGTAQSQVSGVYSGSGSFSASAGSDDGKRGALSQVSGGEKGALSSAQGRGGTGNSQAQVQLSSKTGNTISNAQSGGRTHSSQTQVQGGDQGGLANAQSNGSGSTSSQAQIGFTPYVQNDTRKTSPFMGGGTASAQGNAYTGKSQSQIQGKFSFGIRYTGGAQAGTGPYYGKNSTAVSNIPSTLEPMKFVSNELPTRSPSSTVTTSVPLIHKLPNNSNTPDNSMETASEPSIPRIDSTLYQPPPSSSFPLANPHVTPNIHDSHTTHYQPPPSSSFPLANPHVMPNIHDSDTTHYQPPPSSSFPLANPHVTPNIHDSDTTHYQPPPSSKFPLANPHVTPNIHDSDTTHYQPPPSSSFPLANPHVTPNIHDSDTTHYQPPPSSRFPLANPHVIPNIHDSDTMKLHSIETTAIPQIQMANTTINSESAPTEDDDYDYNDEDIATPKVDTINRSLKSQDQHIVLDPLENLDATVWQSSSGDFQNKALQPGEQIPGTPGYMVPPGFRGKFKSVASGSTTYVEGSNSQAQTVALSPGTGRILYKTPRYATSSNTVLRNGYEAYGPIYSYNKPHQYEFKSGDELPNFMSVSKSETGSRSYYPAKNLPSVYYAQSSSCGVFTNTCVFRGSGKICYPKVKTNADGTPMVCS